MSDDKQLLHLVIGGDLQDTQSIEFRDPKQIHFVGAFPNYAEAFSAWRGAAQGTVDNAIRRYFILHAHKLLDPDEENSEKSKFAVFKGAIEERLEAILTTLEVDDSVGTLRDDAMNDVRDLLDEVRKGKVSYL